MCVIARQVVVFAPIVDVVVSYVVVIGEGEMDRIAELESGFLHVIYGLQ